MILDKQLLLSDAQDVKANGAKDSENVIDLSVAGRDLGAGEQLYIVVVVDAYTAGSNTVVTITVQTGATTGLDTVILSKAIATANISAGMVPVVIPIPPGTAEQYLGLVYDCTTAATALNVTAFVAKDIQTNL
jgi:hypothetical protein